jgi:hypothetical protein
MAKIDSKKLIEQLKIKWNERPCPMCGEKNWSVQDTIFELREFQHGSMVIGNGPLVPVAPVTCNNCGNTFLINAIVAGLLERDGTEKKNA